MGNRRRGQNGIGVDDEIHLVQRFVCSRRVPRRTGQRIGALNPYHFDRIRFAIGRLAGFDGMQNGIGVCPGNGIVAVHAQTVLPVESLCRDFGRKVLRAGVVVGAAIERVMGQRVATRTVEVAAYGNEVGNCQVELHGGQLLVHGEAPLNGRIVAGSVEACSSTDVFRIKPADFSGPLRRCVLDRFGQLVEIGAPAIHEFMIVQIFFDDHMQECHDQGTVGAGPQLQEVFGTSPPPGQARIDGDDLRAHLHTVDQPMAHVSVGIRSNGLVAPHHENLGWAPIGIRIPVFEALGRVHQNVIADRGDGPDRARRIARIARKEQHAYVRRLQRSVADDRVLPVHVAAGAVHAHDGLRAVFFLDCRDLLFYLGQRLIPADPLPFVFPSLPRTAHRVLDACGIVDRLVQVKAAHAQLPVRPGAQRIPFHLDQLVVLCVEQHATGIVAARGRPLIGARNGVAVFLPLQFAFVIGFAVDRIQMLLVIEHPCLLPRLSAPEVLMLLRLG